jgi:hypothetical protein
MAGIIWCAWYGGRSQGRSETQAACITSEGLLDSIYTFRDSTYRRQLWVLQCQLANTHHNNPPPHTFHHLIQPILRSDGKHYHIAIDPD